MKIFSLLATSLQIPHTHSSRELMLEVVVDNSVVSEFVLESSDLSCFEFVKIMISDDDLHAKLRSLTYERY